ncbi:MAG: prolyl-tRNA synthetase associated domain-containing protein [Pseudomonadota bacterium]
MDAHLGEAELLAMLRSADIAVTRHAHPPLHTVAEAQALRSSLPGAHTKNLFLKSKRRDLLLICCLEDRMFDLRDLETPLGVGRLSFASAERLAAHLGVTPGAVTPVAVVNDRNHAVRVILDAELMRQPILNVHPLQNSATIAISPEGLRRFFDLTGHRPELFDFGAIASGEGERDRDGSLERGATPA